MSYCPSCGAELVNGAKFCHACGADASCTTSNYGAQNNSNYSNVAKTAAAVGGTVLGVSLLSSLFSRRRRHRMMPPLHRGPMHGPHHGGFGGNMGGHRGPGGHFGGHGGFGGHR